MKLSYSVFQWVGSVRVSGWRGYLRGHGAIWRVENVCSENNRPASWLVNGLSARKSNGALKRCQLRQLQVLIA